MINDTTATELKNRKDLRNTANAPVTLKYNVDNSHVQLQPLPFKTVTFTLLLSQINRKKMEVTKTHFCENVLRLGVLEQMEIIR